MDPSQYNPASDIPDLSGKVFLITGGKLLALHAKPNIWARPLTKLPAATAGLGAGTVRNLASHNPGHIYLTGRNKARAEALIADIHKTCPSTPLTFIQCDLARLASVKALAQSFLASSRRLDVLLCNAGIMAHPAAQTVDGYELQFQTNVLAHALLVKLLKPILDATVQAHGDARVIMMGSTAHNLAPSCGVEIVTLRSPQDGLGGVIPGGRWSRYGQSKLADMLYAAELARREPSYTTVSVHPGVIATNLFDDLPFFMRIQGRMANAGKFISVDHGTYNQTWAASCPKSELQSGEYYEPVKRVGKRAHKKMDDRHLAGQLYDWIEKELQGF